MKNTKLEYLGPAPRIATGGRSTNLWRRLPLAFLFVVGVPTILATIYYLLIASPIYVSEARFIVRAPSQSQPSSLGVALQGVGISAGQTDAFAVHEYIGSRDALQDLMRRYDVAEILAPRGSDALTKAPRFWEKRSFESLYEGYRRFITVGYDSTTGISTLRVRAFRARDAQNMAREMLNSGEALVNRLNERSAADALVEAQAARDQAQAKLDISQQQMGEFRNREQFIDPSTAATEHAELIGSLLASAANARAERAQLASQAPASPQLSVLDSRISAYDAQIAAERAQIAGSAGALAPKVGIYESLSLQRELASRELIAATTALVSAQQESSRQKLYLDRVVNPSLPDVPLEPSRWLAILTIFASAMLVYGVGWLIWAGVREHRQG